MIINRDKFKFSITELLMLIVSIILLAGSRTWFSVCPVMSEMIMACHWAGEVLKAVSIFLAAASVVHILIHDQKIKLGMDIPFLGICLMTAFVPGGIINLCQSEDMACRQSTKPWTIILCAAFTVIILADVILYASRISREKHQRKVS